VEALSELSAQWNLLQIGALSPMQPVLMGWMWREVLGTITQVHAFGCET
jgi:hypothetical protein